ncbi:MAG TPA: hypothetical protein VJ743_23490 [Albitalea sp.]|nr:hypothetical protein [Albitalea sp.]
MSNEAQAPDDDTLGAAREEAARQPMEPAAALDGAIGYEAADPALQAPFWDEVLHGASARKLR